ncbi:MAG: metal ABC transporter ATP-binding protein [Pyrobaculum sp.]
MLLVKDLVVYRGGVPVLEGVSFAAGAEFVLVAGPNGAGKSSLFLAILAMTPHEGEICVDNFCDKRRVERVGYVPQFLKVDMDATVWEYVYLPARFRNGRDATRAAEEALRLVELSRLKDRPLVSLSGGELQRAAIARALAVGGDVLLLDEPLANVDPGGRLELINLLRELKKDRTVLMSSHELTLPLDLADKILLLNRRLMAYGPVEEVLREEVLRRVYRFVRVAKTSSGYVCVTEDYGH